VYLLLLAWQPSALYFDPGRFAAPQIIGDRLYTRSVGDILYYSFVTLGTVGYGDVTPSSPLARSLSLIEAVIGIMYVGRCCRNVGTPLLYPAQGSPMSNIVKRKA
jgi:Ion channel